MTVNKILVTGATGFVGSALCALLARCGVPYAAAVRQGDGGEALRTVGDLSADTDWSAALEGCDVVIHLAARVHVMDETSNDPLQAFRAVNVEATMNLARQALASGVRRMVYVSSVKVNGEQTGRAAFTAFDKPAPQDPYGVSKLEAETGLLALARASGLEVVIVRPPLVYGPGVKANFLKLMQLAKSGVPLPFGSIYNRRSMVAVDNLADFLLLCSTHPQAAGQVFMVSDGADVGVTQLLRMFYRAMGKRAPLLPVPAGLIGGVARFLGKAAVADRLLGSLEVDIAHTKDLLGWRPPLTMHEAIDAAVSHFLSHS